MGRLTIVAFLFSALIGVAFSDCHLDGLMCCLAEFSGIVKPSGIYLSEERISSVCTFEDDTVICMDAFVDQCIRNETDVKEKEEIQKIVNKTEAFITEICPPKSDFIAQLKKNEKCILKASESFQKCYNKTVMPKMGETNEDAKKRDCCEYKNLRNCAVQTVEDECGQSASQLIQEEVVNLNGAIMEWACKDLFEQCSNSAATLAASIFLVLYSYTLLKILL